MREEGREREIEKEHLKLKINKLYLKLQGKKVKALLNKQTKSKSQSNHLLVVQLHRDET